VAKADETEIAAPSPYLTLVSNYSISS